MYAAIFSNEIQQYPVLSYKCIAQFSTLGLLIIYILLPYTNTIRVRAKMALNLAENVHIVIPVSASSKVHITQSTRAIIAY